ncbi:MAG: hypothetical protein ABH807_00370 [Candidatus Shapirobacteria bacterium]
MTREIGTAIEGRTVFNLIERPEELEVAIDLVNRGINQGQAALTIVGEKGLGKSTFLEQLAGELRQQGRTVVGVVSGTSFDPLIIPQGVVPSVLEEVCDGNAGRARAMILKTSWQAAAYMGGIPIGTLGLGMEASLDELGCWVEVGVRQLAGRTLEKTDQPLLLLADLGEPLPNPESWKAAEKLDRYFLNHLAGVPGLFLVLARGSRYPSSINPELRLHTTEWPLPAFPLSSVQRLKVIEERLTEVFSLEERERWLPLLKLISVWDVGLREFEEINQVPGLAVEPLGDIPESCSLERVIIFLRRKGLLYFNEKKDGWTLGYLGDLLQHQLREEQPEIWRQVKLAAFNRFYDWEAEFRHGAWTEAANHYLDQYQEDQI